MKKLPVDVSDLPTMITGDYVYVDKTKQIYDLITGGRLYFLSRPRRFGKSLLISTLKEIFLANKKLFENLWIGTSDYDWHKYPVIHLDFSVLSYQNADAFRTDLTWTFENIAKSYGITISDAPSLETKLRSLVMQLSEQDKVVMLIDEYDYPLLKHIRSPETAKTIRDVLSAFFAVIKALNPSMRALFITGVTKFSKTSIFSGMNNLNDISLDLASATLLGYTQEEIDTYFTEAISLFSQKQGKKESAIKKEMQIWYNGYKFSGSTHAQKVYNPFSILYYLQKQERKNFWFASGTPTFLVELLKEHYNLSKHVEILDNIVVSDSSLNAFDIEAKLPLYTLLFQSGYLTIKSHNAELNAYTLTIPNEEVRVSINSYLMSIVTHKDKEGVDAAFFAMKTALENNDVETFCLNLQSLFASIPYNLYINNEAYFHSIFHLLTTLLGLEIQSEVHTSKGRIDLTLLTKKRIFIFEFKFNASGKEALQQILDKRYYEKYLTEKKPISLVGISFNFDEKKLTLDRVIREYEQEIV